MFEAFLGLGILTLFSIMLGLALKSTIKEDGDH